MLGFSTGENSSLHGDGAPKLIALTETFLQGLFHKYPHGHIFSLSEQLQGMSSSKKPAHALRDETNAKPRSHKKQKRYYKKVAEHTETKALLQMLPGTRSVAFVPLWDSHRERWFAGSFIWTVQNSTRVLTRTEDLNYLSAFGNSIMAEVARLDVVGADRAKSDFISSISHELRSPLHGILASVEFLRDTTVDLFQHGMIDTIERCGRTLLDTIQHVLDFAKINNFNRPNRKGSAGATRGPGRPRTRSGVPASLAIDFDISLLAEDVIDSVFAGHVFQGNSSLVVTDEATGFPPEGLRRSSTGEIDDPTARDQHESKRDQIEVIMDIGWRPNWTFNSQSGALRRVLMNLFGNALKYTSSGWVKVSLQARDIESTLSKPEQSIVTIRVRDTGRGIGKKYLHSGLFVPFTQEFPLNPGTGLGLSIVLQIVRSLGGTIDVTSEEGVGTEVVVTLTLDQGQKADPLRLNHEGDNIIQNARRKTSGLTIGLVGLDVNQSPRRGARDQTAESELSLILQASVEGMATHWFDMKVVAPSKWQTSPPAIYVANE